MISLMKTYPDQILYIVSEFEVIRQEILRVDYNHIHFKCTQETLRDYSFHRAFYTEKEALGIVRDKLYNKVKEVEEKLGSKI